MISGLHALPTAPPADIRPCLQEQRERARQRASRFGTTDTLDAKVESLRQAQGERQRKRDRAERFNMEVEAEDDTGQEDAGVLIRGVRQGDPEVERCEPAMCCAVASWLLGLRREVGAGCGGNMEQGRGPRVGPFGADHVFACCSP